MSESVHEKKLSKRIRGIISFVLFVLIVIMSLSICAKISFLSPSTVEKQFTGYSYSSAVRDNVAEYVKDMCKQNAIDEDNVDEVFSYVAVNDVIKAYYGYYITDRMEYSEESYKTLINGICEEYKGELKEQLAKAGSSYNEASAESLKGNIEGYFLSCVEMPKMDSVKSVFNIGNIIMYIIIGISIFFVLSLILIEAFVGTKRQRSIRAIAISFMSAGVFELILSGIIYIISINKTVDVFPVYLSEQFLSYVYTAITDIVYCAGMLLLISVVIMSLVWKMRKKDY